jgi:hypothetical protein
VWMVLLCIIYTYIYNCIIRAVAARPVDLDDQVLGWRPN